MSAYLRGSEYYESKKLQPGAVTVTGNIVTAKLKGHGPEVRRLCPFSDLNEIIH